MIDPARIAALMVKWREAGRRIDPLYHKAIHRADGGAADVYDAERRAYFACADELEAALRTEPQRGLR